MVRLIQERKAGHAADTLIQQIKTTVSVYRQGQQLEISSEELVVGDTVSLSAGERVPADLRLIEAQDLFVSQALLTGESNVLEKNTNRLASATQIPLDRFSNIAFMGSSVISGEGKGIVLAVGGSTVYGGYLSELQRNKHSFDTGANSIAWVLIRFMVALVPVVFVVSGITKGDWLTSFLFSLSVAVGLTPELLPMVINACLAKGSSAMGQKQTIVKNINAMQSFGSMDVLCVDKTGTLTGDEVILEYYLDILGEESREVLDCAYLNSFYHTGVANHLDQTILKCSEVLGLPLVVEADDLHLGGEFLHHLPAGAAGDAVVLALPSDDDAFEIPMALNDGLEDGGAFGTDGEAVGGVFNVAAGVGLTIFCQQGCAYFKIGIWCIRILQLRYGSID